MFKMKPLIITLKLLGVLSTLNVSLSVKANSSDPHSYSNPDQVRVTDIAFNLNLHFDKKQIGGRVLMSLDRLNSNAPLILDTMDLKILNIVLVDKHGDRSQAKFELAKAHKILGSALKINLTKNTQKVEITYRTSTAAAGVQWLGPESTSSHKHFMFTQSAPIGARSWFPCQDTPQVRTTYKATVKAPIDLMVIMSAKNANLKSNSGTYHFEMKQPIPSYLIALAAGDLQFAPLGERTGVYAEPTVLAKAQYEFSEVEKMFTIAEKMFGPYRWERFDVLVMPFSFPYGGMENPRLTFVSPTTLAGDRSLTYVLAHELAHSWSGNLATNASWNDFWLNEGTTTYFEHRILEALYGTKRSEVEWALSYSELLENVKEFENNQELTKLHTHLDDRNPEDGFNGLPYNKGAFLFYYLESQLGRRKLDEFWAYYFSKYAFKSVTTNDFLDSLSYFFNDPRLIDDLDIKTWIYEANIPSTWSPPSFPRVKEIQTVAQDFIDRQNVNIDQITSLDSRERGIFLDQILVHPQLNQDQTKFLEASFGLANSSNAELLTKWFQISMANRRVSALPQIEEFLKSTGRMRFLVPVYKAMNQTKNCQIIDFANNAYKKARSSYFRVTQNRLDKMIQSCPQF